MNVSADDLSEISAKSAIVIDGETGDVLFEKNAYERRPMASTTKIMSVLLVLESGEDLDKQFVVDSEAIKVEGSSMMMIQMSIIPLQRIWQSLQRKQ